MLNLMGRLARPVIQDSSINVTEAEWVSVRERQSSFTSVHTRMDIDRFRHCNGQLSSIEKILYLNYSVSNNDNWYILLIERPSM